MSFTNEELEIVSPDELNARLGDDIEALSTLFVIGGGVAIGVNENYPDLGVVGTIELVGFIPEQSGDRLYAVAIILPEELAVALKLEPTNYNDLGGDQ